jgi:TRAP-type C4-dicarboxylate transport system permease small subunit
MDRQGHLAMGLLTKNLPHKLRKYSEIFVYIVILLSLGILVKSGFNIVAMTTTQLSAAMQIPLAWVYLSIPLGSAFMFIHALSQCVSVLLER